MARAMVVPTRRFAGIRFWSCFPFDGVAAFSASCCSRAWACASSLSRCTSARFPATCLRRLRVALPISFGAVAFFVSFSFMGNCLLYGFFFAGREPDIVWGKRQDVASACRQDVACAGAGCYVPTEAGCHDGRGRMSPENEAGCRCMPFCA